MTRQDVRRALLVVTPVCLTTVGQLGRATVEAILHRTMGDV